MVIFTVLDPTLDALWWVAAEQAKPPVIENTLRRLATSARPVALPHAEAAPFLRWAQRQTGWMDDLGISPLAIEVPDIGQDRWRETWRADTCYPAGWEVRDSDGDLWRCLGRPGVQEPGNGMGEWRKLRPNGRMFATGPYALPPL